MRLICRLENIKFPKILLPPDTTARRISLICSARKISRASESALTIAEKKNCNGKICVGKIHGRGKKIVLKNNCLRSQKSYKKIVYPDFQSNNFQSYK